MKIKPNHPASIAPMQGIISLCIAQCFCLRTAYQFPKQLGPCAKAQSQGNSLRQRAAKAARAERIHTTLRALGRRVGEDVAERWLLPVNIGRASEGQEQQAGCERARGCKGEERRPPESPKPRWRQRMRVAAQTVPGTLPANRQR